jgi:hypothetical protein
MALMVIVHYNDFRLFLNDNCTDNLRAATIIKESGLIKHDCVDCCNIHLPHNWRDTSIELFKKEGILKQ